MFGEQWYWKGLIFNGLRPLCSHIPPSSHDSHANLHMNRGWWHKLWESGRVTSELAAEATGTDLSSATWLMPLPKDQCIFSQKVTGLGYTPLATYWLPQHLQESLWTYCSGEFGWDWLTLSKLVKVGRGMNWCRHRQHNRKKTPSSALGIIHIWKFLTPNMYGNSNSFGKDF